MRNFSAIAVLALFAVSPIAYFKYQRPLQLSGSGQQYAVIDDAIMQHSLHDDDLGDLRLYSGQAELPYALTVERGALHQESRELRVLQPATVAGKTQFILDMAGLAEYDHVELKLGATNFVAHARVEGNDDLHAPRWADLGGTIVYDLSRERLGGNSTLRLPLTTYKYLRITIDGAVKPTDVKSASASVRQEEKAVWRDVGGITSKEQRGKDTVLTFTLPEHVPIERVSFAIDPAQPNFRRAIEIENDKKEWLGSGELSRVHIVRLGQKIDSECTDIGLRLTGPATVKVVIHNGDDPPLRISSARLRQFERRIYFNPDPQSSSPVLLYYGDKKLGAPEYDYAKLFQKNPNASAASWGEERANPDFSERPDDRPWSDRHPAVLWIAIIAAVLALGIMAIRSLKAAPGNQPTV
jgi:hypothetical protein